MGVSRYSVSSFCHVKSGSRSRSHIKARAYFLQVSQARLTRCLSFRSFRIIRGCDMPVPKLNAGGIKSEQIPPGHCVGRVRKKVTSGKATAIGHYLNTIVIHPRLPERKGGGLCPDHTRHSLARCIAGSPYVTHLYRFQHGTCKVQGTIKQCLPVSKTTV